MPSSVRLLPPRAGQLIAYSLGFLALLLVFAPGVQAQQLSIPGVQSPVEKNGSARQEEPLNVRAARGEAPLNRLHDYIKVSPSKVRRLPALAPREAQDAGLEKRLRIGEVRAFPQPVKVSSDSALYRVAEGDVRVMGVVSEGARYTRVHFTGMSLPAGARVFVYSLKNPDEFYGPYEGRGPSGDGTFWTPPMEGEGVAIEYFTPHGAGDSSVTPFQVSEVSHIFRDSLTKAGGEDAAGACNLDVAAEWSEVAKSVGELQFTSDGSEYLCTGTLLNNQANDFTPYLLTANHCFNTQAEAQTLRVYWNYNSGDIPPAGTLHTDGANLLATGTGSDFTFVLLTGSLPGGLFFAGWDANPISAATPVTGIHHPDGSHKRISFGATNSNCVNGLPGPCKNFTGVTWSSGTTEPGSSGSGIWKGTASSPQFVGTLTGGGASCASPTLSDYYGLFSVTYPSISAFLTTGTGASCVSALSPTSQNFSTSGGTGSISVTAPSGCNWTAAISHSFVTVTSGASGSGNGTITFSVAANNGAYRTAVIVVGTKVFTITQAGYAGNSCGSNTITLGQTANGILTTRDCERPNGSYYDIYTFQGTPGQQIYISASASFNTYMIVGGPGDLILTDDDGGGGTNSRIPAGSGLITLPSYGPYNIMVSSFLPYVNGSYTLTVDGPPLSNVIPVASISDASVVEGNSGVVAADFNITLSEPSRKSVCVMASTADWTAIAGSDYRQMGGNIFNPPAFVFFDPGVTTITLGVGVLGDSFVEPDEMFGVIISPCNADVTVGRSQGIGTIIDDDQPPTIVQLSTIGYVAGEASGHVEITVNRSNPIGASSVDYATSDDSGLNPCSMVDQYASSRCDYATTVGTLKFAAGESSKIIYVPIIDDNISEANELFHITLSHPTGAILGSTTSATVLITDNANTKGNPIDDVPFFVREHYIDFLGREPDPAGLAGWQNVLNNCGVTIAQPCDRIEVSAGFFRSPEFQDRGYLVYRFYSAVGKIPLYERFMPDFAKVSGFLSAQELEANKVAFVNEFMTRPDFQNRYGTLLDPTAYVGALLQTVELPNHPGRQGWITGLTNSSLTRGQVLRSLVESTEVYQKYYTEAFVIMQYFGYLRRSADSSYLDWIQTMNSTGGDYRTMINGFLNSAEYRNRFGN